MQRKKIALFIVSLAAGGAERVVSNLLKHLSAEYDFHLILLNETIQYDLPSNITLHFLDKEKLAEPTLFGKLWSLFKMPFLAFRLKNYCEKHHISIVFSLLSRSNYISCFLKVLKKELTVIISQRTNVSSFYASQGFSDKLNRWLISHLFSYADLIVSNSKGTEWDLREHYGFKNARSVVYNPFDFDKIAQLKAQNTEGGIIEETFTFISVGRLNVVKNYSLLLQAFAQLDDKTSQLIIVGDASQSTENLPELARALSIDKRVIFTGFQSNPFKFMSKADCFVMSSDSEGFPNVLIEAMACGLPIISTDCPSGPRELLAPQSDFSKILKDPKIEKAEFGILTPTKNVECLAEAMNLMQQDTILRQTYRDKNALRLKSFELDSVLNDFRQIFDH
ncbi:MAG: glycosyltransferase [Saprospiraceae bacterium]|nr:glycosyltransferase [Saprospiraceae bacterium]